MLKVPFFEHTTVGLEITDELVRWVEMDRRGKRWTLIGFGEIRHNQSEQAVLAALGEIKEAITADAWHCALQFPSCLKQVIVEELPYFEEPEDVDAWIFAKEKEIAQLFEVDDHINYQSIEVDEDTRRMVFQVVDGARVAHYVGYIEKAGFYPQLITTGLTETGYSQLFEDAFTEDITGLVQQLEGTAYLTVYSKGLVQNVYPLAGDPGDIPDMILQADSYLKSEENSAEYEMSSSPLITRFAEEIDDALVQRELIRAQAFGNRKGFEELPGRYAAIIGSVVKLNYPALDGFNVAGSSSIENGIKQHDKAEAIRVSVLLFTPLIVFFLLIFAASKLVDYQLIESNQVMNRIGDRLEEVTGQREQLLVSKDHFLEVKSLLEERDITAPIFGIISEEIGTNLWLESLTMDKTGSGEQQVRLAGYSSGNRSLTEFLDALEQRKEINAVQLHLSEAVATRGNKRNAEVFSIGTVHFELVFLVQ